jgi:hypothetical protein
VTDETRYSFSLSVFICRQQQEKSPFLFLSCFSISGLKLTVFLLQLTFFFRLSALSLREEGFFKIPLVKTNASYSSMI